MTMKLKLRVLALSAMSVVGVVFLVLLIITVEHVELDVESVNGGRVIRLKSRRWRVDLPQAVDGINSTTAKTSTTTNKSVPVGVPLMSPDEVEELRTLVETLVRRRKGQRLQDRGKTVAEMLGIREEERESLTSFKRFQLEVSEFQLYSEGSGVEELRRDMAVSQIVQAEEKEGGTQLKLVLTFENDGRALFKPMRFPREQQTLPNHFYFVDFERHNAEVAAFHLDRILGFRRVPPSVGRLLNMTSEIYDVTDENLAKTFFVSPARNLCFTGHCAYYCTTSHAACASRPPDMIEGSLAAYLPSQNIAPRRTWRHPWRRSYSRIRNADWEVGGKKEVGYCDRVRAVPPYSQGRRMLDLTDLAVFDFLTGNMDRHHYETIKMFGNTTFILHLDQGRAFGRHSYDEMSILAPVTQCCLIRYTTFCKLLHFLAHHTSQSDHEQSLGSRLSDALRQLEPQLGPVVLVPEHFAALDRRVNVIVTAVRTCIDSAHGDVHHVVVDDGF